MLLNTITPNIESVYYDHQFMILLESHLIYLKSSDNVKVLNVSDHQNDKYIGDFYGLLDDLSIQKKFHYIVTRLNDLDNSNDFKGDKSFILVPDFEQIELLKSLYQTRSVL